jgi:hypothetical protein
MKYASAIISGNSGGPLFDTNDMAIGVITEKDCLLRTGMNPWGRV